MGVVIQLLVAVGPGGFDLLPDPLGWVLVLVGVRRLPEHDLRLPLVLVTGLATVASLPLWVPAVIDALDDADESIAWAANLPKYGAYLLLCVVLGRLALEAGDQVAARWWSALTVGCAAIVALPVLIFGGGLDDLTDPTSFLLGAVPTVLVVVLFWYSSRSWAGAPPVPTEPADG